MQDVSNKSRASGPPERDRTIGRRGVVAAGAAAVAAGLAACGSTGTGSATERASQTAAQSAAARSASTRTTSAAVPAILGTDGPDIAAGPRTSNDIALTFHGAGPTSMAGRLLDILNGRRTRVTVFAVGTWAATNHPLLQRILAEGHDLGSHTWSHRPMRTLSLAEADSEVARGAAAVAALRHGSGPLFRPSGTPPSSTVTRAAAHAAGYHRCISYDVDSLDYTDPGPDAVVQNVLRSVRGGSIISLHFGHQGTVDALPKLLDVLAAKGFRPRTVTGLLSAPGDPVVVKN